MADSLTKTRTAVAKPSRAEKLTARVEVCADLSRYLEAMLGRSGDDEAWRKGLRYMLDVVKSHGDTAAESLAIAEGTGARWQVSFTWTTMNRRDFEVTADTRTQAIAKATALAVEVLPNPLVQDCKRLGDLTDEVQTEENGGAEDAKV
jgi:hypothetical protein